MEEKGHKGIAQQHKSVQQLQAKMQDDAGEPAQFSQLILGGLSVVTQWEGNSGSGHSCVQVSLLWGTLQAKQGTQITELQKDLRSTKCMSTTEISQRSACALFEEVKQAPFPLL